MAEETLRCQVGRVTFKITNDNAERVRIIVRAAERLNVLLREKKGDPTTPFFADDEQVITYIALELMSIQLSQEEQEMKENMAERIGVLNNRITEILND